MRLPLEHAHSPVTQSRQIWFLFGQPPVWKSFGVRSMFMTDAVWLVFRRRGWNHIKPMASSRGKQSRRFRFTRDRALSRYHFHSGRRKTAKEGTLRRFVVEKGK